MHKLLAVIAAAILLATLVRAAINACDGDSSVEATSYVSNVEGRWSRSGEKFVTYNANKEHSFDNSDSHFAVDAEAVSFEPAHDQILEGMQACYEDSREILCQVAHNQTAPFVKTYSDPDTGEHYKLHLVEVSVWFYDPNGLLYESSPAKRSFS